MPSFDPELDGHIARVTWFQIIRAHDQLDIRVHEALTGPRRGMFVAIPTLIVFGHERYYGEGVTAEDAVVDCLRKMRGEPLGKIFPRLGEET